VFELKELGAKDHGKVVKKFEEFMVHCQKLKPNDTYLIVNRNSPTLAESAQKAAENCRLNVKVFELGANKAYKHFPKQLLSLLHNQTPKAGISLFDYSLNPDWNLKEVGARIEFLHQTIEQVPVGWGHSPGITLDMAINGPIQCDYRKMSQEADLMLQKLAKIKRIHITSPRGTDIEIGVPKHVKFDTDCIIVPPNVYGYPGKFGNLPVGEVWSERGEIIEVTNKGTGRPEEQSYPVKQIANGKLVCDVTAGGYTGKIDPEKPIVAQFKNGILTELHSEDPALDCIREDIRFAEKQYSLPTVLEEVGIGLNDKARITGNMLEDEKLRGTCHLAPGNVRCHVDLLVDKPTIVVSYTDGTKAELMKEGGIV
jgi:aminopeptidase